MLAVFPSPAGMSLTKISLARNNLIIPVRESLISDRLGTGKQQTFFLQCIQYFVYTTLSIFGSTSAEKFARRIHAMLSELYQLTDDT
jgi:hypothetical protein